MKEMIRKMKQMLLDFSVRHGFTRFFLKFYYERKNNLKYEYVSLISIVDMLNDKLYKKFVKTWGGEMINGKKENVHCFEICNVKVWGGNDTLRINDLLVNDRMNDIVKHKLGFNPSPPGLLMMERKTRTGLIAVKSSIQIGKGIFLLGRYTINWWHLVMESFARMFFISEIEDYRDWPILVNENIKADCRNLVLLEKISKGHEIIFVQENQQLEVKTLLYVSSPVVEGNFSEKFVRFDTVFYKDMRFAALITPKEVVNGYRFLFAEYIGQEIKKKYMIVRKGDRFINEEEIANILSKRGFEVLSLDKISLIDEIKIFGNADKILISLGAAMTNLIFCDNRTKVVVPFPKKYLSVMYIYYQIAECLGISIVNIDTEVIDYGVEENITTFQYKMDIGRLEYELF